MRRNYVMRDISPYKNAGEHIIAVVRPVVARYAIIYQYRRYRDGDT